MLFYKHKRVATKNGTTVGNEYGLAIHLARRKEQKANEGLSIYSRYVEYTEK